MTISPKPGEGRPCRMARVDGGEVFPLVREDIVSTEHEFLFQTYGWQSGHDLGRKILCPLRELEIARRAKRASEPVQVRFLIDLSIGCVRAVERWLTWALGAGSISGRGSRAESASWGAGPRTREGGGCLLSELATREHSLQGVHQGPEHSALHRGQCARPS